MCATTKYVSESCTSTGTEPRNTPEIPPIVNTTMKAIAKSIAVRKRSALSHSEEVRPRHPVEEQKDAGDRQEWHREHEQEARHEDAPAEERDAVERHSGCAKREDRHDHVQRPEDRGEAQDGEREDHEVHTVRRRELLRRERRVDRPPGRRRTIYAPLS